MANVEVEILGLKELERELAALPDKIGKRVLRRAVRDGAGVFLAQLRSRVSVITGRLRGSLAIATKFRQFSFSAWMGSLAESKRHHILRFLERGTGHHLASRYGKLSGRSARFAASGRGIQPRRWIEKSFEAGKERALAFVRDRLAAYIAKYRSGS
jgi:hypothetical protein